MSERQDGGTRDEILFLKRQNAALRGQNKKLQERVEHYKMLAVEGDVLYENKIAECEALAKELKTSYAQCHNAEMAFHLAKEQEKRLLARIESLTKENDALHKEMECRKEKKPWYKRLF